MTCVYGIFRPALAENYEQEKRWAEQLREFLVIGEAVDLPLTNGVSGASSFFAIFTPQNTAKPKGAVILLHGTGAHPDWSDVIHPLRTQLPDKGWATLSLQMPLLNEDKKTNESRTAVIEASIERINAAVKFINDKGEYKRIHILGHSFGALMTLNYLVNKSATQPFPVSGAILIGTPSIATKIPLNSPAMIEQVAQLPLLDLYGSNDLRGITETAKFRKAAALKAGNNKYRQKETIGANHFYSGLDDELVQYVSSWLSLYAAQ